MNIVSFPYYYYPHKFAGGEVYMHRLLKGLQSLGHDAKVCILGDERYEYDGIEVYPHSGMQHLFTENNDICTNTDVIFTQLIGCATGYNKARQHNKPLVFFAHNVSKHYAMNGASVVYNSNFLSNLKLFENNSTILQPLSSIGPQSYGKKIALINCNQFKGGAQFIELAKRMPQYQFLGIKGGYGEQIMAKLPNLEYKECLPVVDWAEIGLLLVLSETESWSLVASEAICHGIPVVCNDLPALRENLSYAGVYLDRNNLDEWVTVIDYLMWDRSKQVELCQKRAKEYEPEKRLKEFEQWLCNIIQ